MNNGNSLIIFYNTLMDSEKNIRIIIKTKTKNFFIKKINNNLYNFYEDIESSIITLKLLLNIISVYKIVSMYILLNYNKKCMIYPKKYKRSNSI